MRRSSLTRGGLLAAAAAVTACAAAAQDGGVLFTFGIEQRLELGRNLDLAVPASGQTTASVTRLSFGVVSQTGLDLLEFNASTALVVQRSDDTSGTEAELGRPELTFRYTREVPNAIFMIAAQYRRDDVDAFDEDLGEDDATGTRTDYGADFRIETGRTVPVGFAFSAAYDRTQYGDTADPDLLDTDTVEVGVETLLRFSEVAIGHIGLGYLREDEAGPTGTLSETVTASAGMDYTLPNGMATALLSLSRDDQDRDRATFEIGRALDLPAGAVTARLGITHASPGGTDLIGALQWSQDLPSGTFDVRLERSVDFDDDTNGSVLDTALTVSLTREVNAVSSMGLDFSHEVSEAPLERIEQSELAAVYRYQLTDDWGLDSGVRYRVRRDADGRSESPDVFVGISRSFEVRP
jgi:hypothetical protein